MNTSEDSETFYRVKPCNVFFPFGGGQSDYSQLGTTSSNVIHKLCVADFIAGFVILTNRYAEMLETGTVPDTVGVILVY